jgi:hypothetical protein
MLSDKENLPANNGDANDEVAASKGIKSQPSKGPKVDS